MPYRDRTQLFILKPDHLWGRKRTILLLSQRSETMNRSKIIACCLLLLLASYANQVASGNSTWQDAQKLVGSGTWEGTLTIGPQKRRLELKVSEQSDKSL